MVTKGTQIQVMSSTRGWGLGGGGGGGTFFFLKGGG